MFSRAYRTVITAPPLLWVAVFLLLPYALMFCYSFWSVSESGAIAHSWNLANYHELLTKTVYWQTLLRSMWIATRVMFFSVLLGYPLAYFLSFHAGARKDLYYQLVIIPLWVSYLVRAYAWKTILGTDGVLNTLLQYVHLTSHPLDFLPLQPLRRSTNIDAHLYAVHLPPHLRVAGTYSAQSGRSLARSGSHSRANFLASNPASLHSRTISRSYLRLRPKPWRFSCTSLTRRPQRHHDLQHGSQPLRSRL